MPNFWCNRATCRVLQFHLADCPQSKEYKAWMRNIAESASATYRSKATVTFTRTDGKTVSFEDVRVDSIGPSAEAPGVIGVEFENDHDRIVHVPFVQSWTISYE